VIPPYRVMVKAYRDQWKMKKRESEDLVFCHNDLSTHNVIVDPETLKINAIIDWEYAGYFPREFEGMFFRRPGPSVALGEEANDENLLLDLMKHNEGS
jgi:aminoglycoside phosphotransferase